MLLTSERFRSAWTYSSIVPIDEAVLGTLDVPERSRAFLRSVGLFERLVLSSYHQIELLPAIEAGDDAESAAGILWRFDYFPNTRIRALYYVKNTANIPSDDFICIEEPSGVVCWYKSDGSRKTFVNSNVEAFSYSFLVWRRAADHPDYQDDGAAGVNILRRLRRAIYFIDRPALRNSDNEWIARTNNEY